ncbi:MAG: transposase family protein [Firmicutes bacterium]|nr:transposase family protein [Bacillota bacterium]
MLCALLSAGSLTLPYHIEHYEKGSTSKIDKICQIVASLPTATGSAYGLCDSWFTCKKIIEAHFKKGYHLIGGLKTNRIIYPQGIRTSIKNFAAYIAQNDVHLVTVNRQSYWVYRYEGALNDIDNAVVLFCWPKDALLNPKALRTFLCTDMALDTETILKYYSRRWPIETFFRQTKGNLGINQYQIRTITGIKRFWSLTALTYLFCTIGSRKKQSFADGLHDMRKNFKKNLFVWIYEQAKSNIPLSQVLHSLKSA